MSDIDNQIEKYVKHFQKKTNLDSIKKEEIDKVLISDKYFEFIDNVYNYFNSKKGSKKHENKERLAIECYLDADEAITHFWKELLGTNLTEEIRSHLKI